MQIMAGIYPIAQVREPYTAVGFLAERLPLQQLLALTHPASERKPHEASKEEDEHLQWSAMDICEGLKIFPAKLLQS